MAVIASSYRRRMRGGTSAHLMLADDGHHYVVKFLNNAQHRRILINELISYVILDYLKLPVPAWDIVEVPQTLISAAPQLTIGNGFQQRPCEPGRHFGSRYPGDPNLVQIHDYLPLSLLWGVENVEAFRGILAFDKWVSNADGRQAIFFRERIEGSSRFLAYSARMIDHGFAFDAQTGSLPIRLREVSTLDAKSTRPSPVTRASNRG